VWYAYLVNDSDFLIESVMVVFKSIWYHWWWNEKNVALASCVCRNTCRFCSEKWNDRKSVLALMSLW
jgi:hypothetical protein